jgi:transcriptional regulator with XRE-family HTH domain
MSAPPPQRFEFWLGATARRCREEAGLSLEDMASHMRVSKEKVDRFEKGRTRPHSESEVVAAYAAVCGIADPRDIYDVALRDWHEHGEAPVPAPASAENGRAHGRRATVEPRPLGRDSRASSATPSA